jgi:hypothetical protein
MTAPLTDSEELLFRQIHPSFFENGLPSSQAFRPTKKDNNKLSVDRSSLTTAKAAFELFVESGYESAAVYGLKVGEFAAERLPSYPDPLKADGKPANPAHAFADFSAFGTNQQKNIAKRLRTKATGKGCVFKPVGA